jgi:hypothetical protein
MNDSSLSTTATSTWGAEDAIRFEHGRQRVHMVTERAGKNPRPMCDYHAARAAERAGLTDQIAYSTGIRDEGERSPFQVHPDVHEGRCADCTRAHGDGTGMPWADRDRPRHAPAERQEQSPMPESEFHRGGWPYRPRNSYERSVPVPATPYSLNSRNSLVAVRTHQADLPAGAEPTQRLAHFISADLPDLVVLAHDSGDSQTIFHCCFCGSGQVIARSDGTVLCEFCHSSFTVQVQPQFSAFPQTIDGAPVDVPGMPSNSAPMPGQTPPPADGGFPPGEGDDPGAEDQDPEDQDDADDDKPAFLKGGLKTAAGSVLDVTDYVRHLAITYGPDRQQVLQRVREERS